MALTNKIYKDEGKELERLVTRTYLEANGSTQINVGSDAEGDLLYRGNDGILDRLGIGTNGQVLLSNGTIPYWGDVGSISESDPIFTAHDAFNVTETLMNNWTTAYNKRITAFALQSGAGTASKTLRITLDDGSFFDASFDDLSSGSGADGNNYPSSLNFNTTTGVLSLGRTDMTDLTIDLDGRYLQSYTETDPVFTGHVASSITSTNISNWTTAYNNEVTGIVFTGTNTKTLTLTQRDGGTLTATFTDLDTGINFRDEGTSILTSKVVNFVGSNVSISDVAGVATVTLTDLNNFPSSLSFNNSTGVLTLGRTGLSSLTSSLDGRYLTSYTETDPIFNAHISSDITSGDITNWTTAYNKRITGFVLQSGSGTASKTLRINLADGTFFDASFDDISGSGGVADGNNFPSSLSFNSSDGILTLGRTGLTALTVDLDGRYLTSVAHIHGVGNAAGVQQFTLAQNDILRFEGTGATTVSFDSATKKVVISSVNTNTFVNNASFNGTTGVLTLTKNDASSVSVDLDGRYLQSETDPIFTSHVANTITSTNISNWNTAYSNEVTGITFTGTTTKTLTLTQRDGGTLTATFLDLEGSSTSIAEPLNQVVFGTGTGVDSSEKLSFISSLSNPILSLIGRQTISSGVLTDQQNGLNLSGTLHSGTASTYNTLVNIQGTSSNTTQNAYALNVDLLNGGTSSVFYGTGRFANTTAGIGTGILSSAITGNNGIYGGSTGTTSGHNAGVVGQAANSTTLNFGVLGRISSNIGSALAGTNLTTTADIIRGYDDTNIVFVVRDGGNVGIGNTAPASKLVVQTAIAGPGTVPMVEFRNTGTLSSDQTRLHLTTGFDTGTGISKGITFFASGTGSGLADYENRSIRFYTGSAVGTTTSRLEITNVGNVIIPVLQTDGTAPTTTGTLNNVVVDSNGLLSRQVQPTIPTQTSQLTNNSNFITRASISATAPITYNNTTGVIAITQATTSTNGYLSSVDWNIFNNKVPTTRSILTQFSITGGGDLSANRTLNLVGDVASPGNNMLYGTSSTGVRGWYPQPSGSGGGLTSAYNRMTDGTVTASANLGDIFKFRSANNRITILVGSNDATHGDNLLITLNEANIVLANTSGSLPWSRITSRPTTLSGYGITDAYTTTQINAFFGGTTVITGYNKTNWDTAFSWGNHAGLYVPIARAVNTQYSITGGGTLSANRTLNLVGDVSAPGNNKLYGTNSSGVRGWYDQPAAGTTGYTTMQDDGVSVAQRNTLNFIDSFYVYDIGTKTNVELSIPTRQNILTSFIALSSNVETNIVSVTLTSGTWLVTGQISVFSGTGLFQTVNMKLANGTTTYASAIGSTPPVAGEEMPVHLHVSTLVTVNTTTTITLKAISNNNSTVYYQSSNMIGYTGMTQINAIKVSPNTGVSA